MAAPGPEGEPAGFSQPNPDLAELHGSWTALRLGAMEPRLAAWRAAQPGPKVVDATQVAALDSAGALLLVRLTRPASDGAATVTLRGLVADAQRLVDLATEGRGTPPTTAPTPPPTGTPHPRSAALRRIGQRTRAAGAEALALVAFVGEIARAVADAIREPHRWRGRPIRFNIRSAGVDALPIVALLSFLLGIVVAYQGADQLRRYGANIFVADLVGVSMLREFAPLITAIIIAGRSGSAYAAQIGTMAVTEEIDAMRTLGIVPLEMLVLPKLVALVIALPLLTVFADVAGVLGGMLMARAQLDVGYGEFLARFVKAVGVSTYGTGLAKAPVFAVLIVVIGCFQGFRTRGGADSVGRQTTRSVVQSIFLVIVADALFSVAFSALDL